MTASGTRARLAASAAALACLAVLTGCGEVQPADVFIVTRTGSTPHAHLTLLVDEEGTVHCNGTAAPHKLSDHELVHAEGIQEDLQNLASQNATLAPEPGSVMSYRVRDENGTVHFSDNSAGQPKVLHELALFVLKTAQQVCGLPE
ncbi:MAG TPA: hypothetical protein VMB91_03100 [Solirubrobacteraceae bacterium]|nr:hypothetical protein [Solirubrobacteraceae bacterium]